MSKLLFITGTDTHIGKTYVSCLLLKSLQKYNFKVLGLKPIASGCVYSACGEFINEDAYKLQQASSVLKPYHVINPIRFAKPIAPHIAAAEQGIELTVDMICHAILSSLQADMDLHIIEGVGGWSVPLNQRVLFSEVVLTLDMPIIMVVGIKLGCLNHALLTYESIKSKGGRLIGWIANCIDPNAEAIEENIVTIKSLLHVPCLGVVDYAGQLLQQDRLDSFRNIL